METDYMGEPLASRRLDLHSPTGKKEILVCIGKPCQFTDGDGFYCPIQVKGLGSEKVQRIGGVDSMQALQLAIKVLSARFASLETNLLSALRWNGEQDLGL